MRYNAFHQKKTVLFLRRPLVRRSTPSDDSSYSVMMAACLRTPGVQGLVRNCLRKFRKRSNPGIAPHRTAPTNPPPAPQCHVPNTVFCFGFALIFIGFPTGGRSSRPQSRFGANLERLPTLNQDYSAVHKPFSKILAVLDRGTYKL